MVYDPMKLSVLAYANGFTLWHYDSSEMTDVEIPAGIVRINEPDWEEFFPDPDPHNMLRAGDLVLVSGKGENQGMQSMHFVK